VSEETTQVPVPKTPSAERVAAVRAAAEAEVPRVLRELAELVAIPSISADPARAGDVAASAEAVAGLFRGLGVGTVDVRSVAGGAPAVLAAVPAPAGEPTVLLYAHHDVQPIGNRSEWTSEPFVATERDGRLFGRGVADDKAGIALHLAAVRALLALDGRLPVGVTVLVEGEEESGSPSLEPFLAEHAHDLAADVMVIADSANWAVGTPSLTVSLRGLVDCTVDVATLDHGVHSGMYGGPVPDALTALCRLLATLHDAAGDVAVAGLVSGPAEEELPVDFRVDAGGIAVPGTEPVGPGGGVLPELDEAAFRADAGLLDGVSLIGTGAITERLWTRPSVTVLGIDATPADEAANVLTPSARAKVSMRIPPGQDPAGALRALTDHLLLHAPWGARVTVVPGAAGEAYAADSGGEVYAAARAALAEAYGAEAVLAGIGGSIPLVAGYTAVNPGATILITAVEDPQTRAHSTDESMHLGDFTAACVAEALLLDSLGRG